MVLLLGLAEVEGREIYYRVERDGTIYFTDIKSHPSLKPFWKMGKRLVPEKQRRMILEIIKAVSEKYGIEYELAMALAEAESGFDMYAVSDKGAVGVMQLMPDIIRKYNVKNPFNPHENIEAGIKYFRFLLDVLGRKDLAVAAYNCGLINVLNFKDVPPYEETVNFVRKVIAKYHYYKMGRGYASR